MFKTYIGRLHWVDAEEDRQCNCQADTPHDRDRQHRSASARTILRIGDRVADRYVSAIYPYFFLFSF